MIRKLEGEVKNIENSFIEGNVSETVIGIGINLSKSENMPVYELQASFADSLNKEINRQILQSEIDCRLARLFDESPNIPKANFLDFTKLASKSINEGFTVPKNLLYRNKNVSFHSVNSEGLVIVCDQKNQQILCDDGESLKWNF